MPMKTVRLRRSRPSGFAIALALALTMLFVYAVSLSSAPKKAEKASAQAHMQQDIHIDAHTARFQVYAWVQDGYAARAEGANCYESGGAGWLMEENGCFAVIFDAAQASDGNENAGNIIVRHTGGVTLQLSGRADQVTAVADGLQFLRSMAVETGHLAASLERSNDVSGVRALMGVYKTQADHTRAVLEKADHPAAALIADALKNTSARIDAAFADTCPAKLRFFHTAANAEWVALAESLKDLCE